MICGDSSQQALKQLFKSLSVSIAENNSAKLSIDANKKIFKQIDQQVNKASKDLAEERGACPDAAEYGYQERFSNKTAIAPTASISIICGGASPGVEPVAANSYTHKTLSGSFNVRNRYLEEILESHGKNDDETWSTITTNQGSVSHLDFLTDLEKDVFKTAFELNQQWIIELSGDRTPYMFYWLPLLYILYHDC